MNEAPPAATWVPRVPPRRLAVFAALGALYFGLYCSLFFRRTLEYFRDVFLTFDFARRWFD